jgi:asparagine synthase (glutamine-hydrolysing)
MCAIAGVVSGAGAPGESLAWTARMLARLGHRGPEGSDIVRLDSASLGHALLSFVIPAAAQPVVSTCGRVAVAFNGQIYNFRELAERYCGDASATEAQAVLGAYLELGAGCFRQFRGMFALAIVDERSDLVLLARDPFGKKPLYYFNRRKMLAFASELTALEVLPVDKGGIDVGAVESYLRFGVVAAPLTMYEGLRKVRPGTCVEFVGGRYRRETCFWTFPHNVETPPPACEEDVVDECLSRLTEAVKRRIADTDRPLGIALSGGIDSGVLSAIATQACPARQWDAFTVGFSGSGLDERAAASAVARHLGFRHHVIEVTGARMADAVVRYYDKLDEPLADPSLVPTLLLCEEARTTVKALLTGDGADELLFGYLSFHAGEVIGWIKRLGLSGAVLQLRSLVERFNGSDALGGFSSVLRMCSRAVLSEPDMRFYDARAPFATGAIPWSATISRRPALELTRELSEFSATGGSDADIMQRAIVWQFLRGVILTKMDRATMLNSIEARSPYLDTDLVGWLATLPRSLKIRPFYGKYLLRRLHARLLPGNGFKRVKQGFRAPIGELLRRELRHLLIDMLTPESVARLGLMDSNVALRLRDEHLRGSRNHERALWSLLCLHVWHQSSMRRC